MKTSKSMKDEHEITASIERGEWTPVPQRRREMARIESVARASQKKDRRVNIRISTSDVRALQARAIEEGLPYQTLIASVLHKFVGNRLVEVPRA